MAIDLTDVPGGSLILGDFDLIGNLPVLVDPSTGLARTWLAETMAEDTEWGDADAVVAEIRSQILDGQVATVSSHENRTATVSVRLTGEDGNDLALAEAALMAEINAGRNTLAWVPDLDGAVPCIFDVVYSELAFEFDDLDEKKRRRRNYTLTLACLPFTRAENKVLIEALPAAPTSTGSGTTPVSVDSGSSTANWTAWSPAQSPVIETPSWSGVSTMVIRQSKAADLRATRTAISNPDANHPFLRVRGYGWITSKAGKGYAQTSFRWSHGAAVVTYLTPVAYTYNATTAQFEALFYLPSGLDANRLRLAMSYTGPHPQNVGHTTLGITSIAWVGDAPFTSTTRQQHRTLPVYGAARTEGELEVRAFATDGTTPTALGASTLVYTRRASAAAAPPLRRWRTNGMPETADASLVSGARSVLDSVAETSVIPAGMVKPGSYQVVARMRSTTTAARTVTVTAATTTTASTLLPANTRTISRTLNFGAVSTWEFVSIGEVTLPTVEVGSTPGNVTLTIASGTDGAVTLDDWWLFSTDDGGLSLVDTSGSGVSMLRIAGATLDRQQPSVWVGTADGVAVVNAAPRVTWWGNHQFDPGEMDVFTVTTTATTARAALRYYPRAHTHLTDLTLEHDITWVDDDLTTGPAIPEDDAVVPE